MQCYDSINDQGGKHMIYSEVTFNPAIDYVVQLEHLTQRNCEPDRR